MYDVKYLVFLSNQKKSKHSHKTSALSNLPKANGPHITRLRSCYDYTSKYKIRLTPTYCIIY